MPKIRHVLRRLGIEVTRYPAPNTFAWQIQRTLELMRIENVIDVGAHEGGFASMLRTVVGYRGPVTSFEPTKASYEALVRSRADDPAWSGHNIALGAESGSLTLNRYASSDFNSILKPSSFGNERFPGLKVSSKEVVQVRRLDQVITLQGPTLIKVDTQGFDLTVLEGAAGLMHNVDAIAIELPVHTIYDGAHPIRAIMDWLAEWGYELVGLFPISRDRDKLRIVEFDGVFVRSDWLASRGEQRGQ